MHIMMHGVLVVIAIANRTMNYCRNNSVDIVIIGWSSPQGYLRLHKMNVMID